MAKRELLTTNKSKTVCMFFSKSKSIIKEPDVYTSGVRLQVVPQYKYLGILIDSKLTVHIKLKLKRFVSRLNLISIILRLLAAAKMYIICILWLFLT